MPDERLRVSAIVSLRELLFKGWVLDNVKQVDNEVHFTCNNIDYNIDYKGNLYEMTWSLFRTNSELRAS
jgi:hypothetical protein